ncbi:MAG: DUF2283 domain-containing protein [Anaerolineae bacterium]
MRITYDPEVDALYIRFRETTVTIEHIGEGIELYLEPVEGIGLTYRGRRR